MSRESLILARTADTVRVVPGQNLRVGGELKRWLFHYRNIRCGGGMASSAQILALKFVSGRQGMPWVTELDRARGLDIRAIMYT